MRNWTKAELRMNDNQKKTYDLVVSLGGNCSAAHNLRFRGLRPVSLPFDWCYLVDAQPIRFWIDEVARGFPNLLKKEHLREILPGDKEFAPAHSDVKQYVDTGSGYRFVNHFHRTIDEPGEYDTVFEMIHKRANRLVSAFERGGSFLLVLATPVDVPIELLKRLVETCSERFGNSHFDLRYCHFEQGHDTEQNLGGGIIVQNVGRRMNDYDFLKTNWEWHFLDNIAVRTKRTHHRKISFRIWPRVDCVISLLKKGN